MTTVKKVSLATTNINIDKNDLLAIAVSRSELHIQQKLGEATKEVRRLEKAVAENEKGLNKHVEDLCAKLAKPLVAKLEAVKASVESSVKVTTQNIVNKEAGTFSVKVNLAENGWGGTTFATLSGEYDATAKGLLTQIATDNALLVTAKATAVGWRQKNGQLPTLERQYRARLAEATLGKTNEGRELLARLGGDFEHDVLMLPSLS